MIKSYVPILKAKLGEFDALKNLRLSRKAQVTPLLDVPQFSDAAGEIPARTWDEHIRRKSERLIKSWGCDDAAIFVDFFDTDIGARTSSGVHPIAGMFDLLRAANIMSIPVTGIGRDDSYQEAVATISTTDRRGMCVRVPREQLGSAYGLGNSLNELLSRMNTERTSTDLVLDFRKIGAEEIDDIRNTAFRIVSGLPAIQEWRSVSFAASSMPQSLATDVRGGTTGWIERLEFACWKSLADHSSKRRIGFADYGIVHPDLAYYEDPKKLTVSATVKYTHQDRILVARGFSLKKVGGDGHEQYYKLAKDVVGVPGFSGENFSWGDEQIERRSRRADGPGNPTSWIAFGTNHHLTLVADQVASAQEG
jgi:hypothetical protein